MVAPCGRVSEGEQLLGPILSSSRVPSKILGKTVAEMPHAALSYHLDEPPISLEGAEEMKGLPSQLKTLVC